MENVILIIHLVLALSLIGIVLLQRSEGGGLGMGGGGGVVSGRAAASALGKLTWLLAIGFICTSIALTIVAARQSATGSVLDRVGDAPAVQVEDAPATDGAALLPPSTDNTDLVPNLD